jgi:ABC-2 type transport system ATP-binding protein
MLELVRRLSRDLGIRVLFSSHVLEDVERTCDAVVVLREGRVAAQGRISDLMGREAGSARLSAFGDIVALRAALTARGLGVEDGDEGWLTVHGAPADLPAAVRDACAEAGVSLRALLPGDRTLEDAVIGAIA